jgi:hypothetical protein
MAVGFTKMAKLEQQEQLGKENDKLWCFTKIFVITVVPNMCIEGMKYKYNI